MTITYTCDGQAVRDERTDSEKKGKKERRKESKESYHIHKDFFSSP